MLSVLQICCRIREMLLKQNGGRRLMERRCSVIIAADTTFAAHSFVYLWRWGKTGKTIA